MDSHRTRAVLVARAQFVAAKVDLGNQIRGVLKTFGRVVGPAAGGAFERRVEELTGDDPTLRPLMAGLLTVWRNLQEQSKHWTGCCSGSRGRAWRHGAS